MASLRTAVDLRDFRDLPSVKSKTANRGGWFSRFLAVIAAARTRQAEREVAIYLAGHGGKFTDEAEREIERRYLSQQSHW